MNGRFINAKEPNQYKAAAVGSCLSGVWMRCIPQKSGTPHTVGALLFATPLLWNEGWDISSLVFLGGKHIDGGSLGGLGLRSLLA